MMKTNTTLHTTTPLWVLVITAIALYANTLFHDYTVDDVAIITQNTFTQKGIRGIPDILSNEGFVGYFGTDVNVLIGGRYRPMSQIFFAIEHELFGQDPFAGHLMNVLSYALLCALVFVVLRRLFDNPIVETGHAPSLQSTTGVPWYFSLPFVATMIFLVHPLHTEVVANIKSRDEILSLMGAMAALYFSLNYVTCHRRDGARPVSTGTTQDAARTVSTGNRTTTLVGVFLTFLFGLLSKENTLTFLAVIPLTMYVFMGERNLSVYKHIIAAMGAAVVVYFAMRYYALGYWLGGTSDLGGILNNPFMDSTTTERVATVLFTWLLYFKLLFIPHPLTHDYYPHHIPILDFSDYRVWLSVVMVALLGYYVIRHFKKNPVVTYGILFFIITFSIVSNLLVGVGTFMNERFLFVPLLGFGMIVGYYVQRWAATPVQETKKWVLPALLIAVGLTLSGLTIHRNRAWKDNFTLFITDVKVSKNSTRSTAAAGEALVRHAELLPSGAEKQDALKQGYDYLKHAVELFPFNTTAMHWQGWAAYYLGYYDEVHDLFAITVSSKVTESVSLPIIAQALEEKGEWEHAKKFYQLALHFFTNEIDRLQLNVGYHMADQDYDAAEEYVNQMLEREPDNSWALSRKAAIERFKQK